MMLKPSTLKLFFFCSSICLSALKIHGQLVINTNATATNLANEIAGPGVSVSNVSLQSAAGGSGIFSNGNSTNIGISNGILLTTGDALDAIGPNIVGNTSKDKTDFADDPDLDAITNYNIKDQCILEFDFVAQGNVIAVQYVFASEEYNEWVCTQYNDLFAFFVTGPKPTGGNYQSQNVALVPGTTMPVSINTINNGTAGWHGSNEICESLAYPNYYVYNTPGASIGYDGFTVNLTSELNIIPGQTYHFKFAVADLSDGLWDAGIFIKADSFSVYNCEAGNLSTTTTEPNFCSDDTAPDIVTVSTSSNAPSDTYKYILTNANGQMLAIQNSGTFNLSTFGQGTFKIYGVSTDGQVSNLNVGQNINSIHPVPNKGCVEKTQPLVFNLNPCKPELECPPNESVQCIGLIPSPDATLVEVESQTCDGGSVVWLSDTPNGTACNGTVIRKYQLTDGCGNVGQCQQTFTNHDTTAPTISNAGANQTVSCGAALNFMPPSATDNCGNPQIVVVSDVTTPGSCPGTYTRTMTWRATDGCGNFSSNKTQSIQVIDNTAPIISGLPENAAVNCSTLPVGTGFAVIATDACDASVNITSTYTDASSGCNTVRTITWTATDDCGNTSQASRTFTSSDTIAPQLVSIPTNSTLECGQPVPNAVINALDNCDATPNVSLTATTVPSACGYSFVRTWTATDDCGNTSTATQTINFEDNTDPVLVGLPQNGTVSCGAIPDGEDFNVTATDNCVNEVVITSNFIDQGSGCNIIRTITWTATDACGNSASAQRIFTSTDNSSPVIVGLPSNSTVACGALPEGDDYSVYANDNCDQAVSIQYSQSDQTSGCNVVRTITWTATDDCGNTSTAFRTFTSSDTIAPQIIGVQSNSTMQCGQAVPDVNINVIDNCDSEPQVSLSANTISSNCGYSFVRTWTATDACGNISTATQTISFEDTTDPILVGLPANATVNCGSVPDGEDFDVSATDNCTGSITITTSYNDQGSGCNKIRTITWTATDACGNSVSDYRTFNVVDEGEPTLAGLPTSATLACGSLPEGDDFAVFANDNCDPAVTIQFTQTDVPTNCGITRTITWTATDNCGNTTSESREFSSSDNIAPQIAGAPSNITLQCGTPVPNATVTAIDNCDQSPEVGLSAITIPSTCGYVFERTWTATDACGNTSTKIQSITYIDEVDPVLVGLPENSAVNCSMIPLPENFNVTATDNCDSDVSITSSFVDQGSGCQKTRVITWTATDHCGNSTSASRSFVSQDEIDPVLNNLPENGGVLCGGLPSTTEYNVSASDNCDQNVNITVVANDSGAGCNVIRTLTWTATDDCGNTVSATRTFTTQDNVAPQFVQIPEDAILQCGAAVPDAVVLATDNCDTEPTISLTANTVPSTCGYSLIRTWTATDDCGNTTSATQTTTFEDTTPPVLVGLPQGSSVSCGVAPDGEDFDVTATDNCVNDITIVSSFIDEGTGCNISRVITWIATDACGNSTSASRTFIITDTSAPQLAGLPFNTTVACGALPAGDDFAVFANDNCDDASSIQYTQHDETSGCNVVRTITWTATDNCGNTSSESRTFTSSDTSAPQLAGVPANTIMTCGDEVPEAIVSAIDNCDASPLITLSANTVTTSCGYTMMRTWTATDACGNSSTASQLITFEDTGDPIFVGLPDESTVNCGSIPEGDDFEVTATDDCSSEVTITSSHFDQGSGCNMTRTITWVASDACGNAVVASRIFQVSDVGAPILVGLPSDAFITCGNLPEGDDFEVYANDNCDEAVSIQYSQSDMNSGCGVVRTITWTATDLCGNTSSQSRTFTTEDNIEPTLIGIPENATLQCGDEVPEATVSASDNCSMNLEVSLSANTVANECGYSLVRTWSVVDDCGNTASASQTTTFIDELAPVFQNIPAGGTMACVLVPLGDDFDVIALDNCDDNVAVTSSFVDSGNGCDITRTITWTATDRCGNTATATRVFITSDESAPVLINLPEGGQTACGNMLNGNDFGVMATDDCDMDVTITSVISDEGNGCNLTRTITWTAMDDCGNEISATRSFVSFDNEAPLIIGVPDDAVLPCGSSVPQAMVEAFDNCDQFVDITLSAITHDGECGHAFIRTWSATDDCGNTSTVTQTITFTDDVAPVLHNLPEEAAYGCTLLPLPEEFNVTATDNCDNNLTVEVNMENVGSGCGSFRRITWTCTDVCGNSISESRIFSVVAVNAPLINGVPSNISVNCNSIPPVANVTATDECGNAITVQFDEKTGHDCPYTIERTWIAIDGCGHESYATQTITVTDNEAPVIHGSFEDMTLSCDDLQPINDVWATDNCDDDVLIVESTEAEPLECGAKIIHTWIATDNCGNQSIATQTYFIVDETSPVFTSVPQNLTVNCNALETAPQLSATDNCDEDVEIEFSEEIVGNGCPYMIKRIWTAIDHCGNGTSIAQIITVTDNEDPTFVNFSPMIQLECDELSSYLPEVTDNCADDLKPVIISETEIQGECGMNIQRTYSVSDHCGNSTTATQLIEAVDNTPPTLLNIPNEMAVQCGQPIPSPAGNVTAVDNCTTDVTLSFHETQSGAVCPYTITRTWVATDGCGNESSASQTIHVINPVPAAPYMRVYPNPSTTGALRIRFSVPYDTKVLGSVYDASGREVVTLLNGLAIGAYVYEWTQELQALAPGSYVFRMTVNGETYNKQFNVVR
jgi:hypothetical protein